MVVGLGWRFRDGFRIYGETGHGIVCDGVVVRCGLVRAVCGRGHLGECVPGMDGRHGR